MILKGVFNFINTLKYAVPRIPPSPTVKGNPSFMSRITFALLLLISSISNAFAAQDFAECKQFFVNGAVPVVTNHPNTRALCFDEFAVLHSGQSKTPVYVAERLNKEKIDAKVKRAKKFFADARLPRAERAELDDYKSSGYDRGHMAPAETWPQIMGWPSVFR
jgi:endonuclease G